MSGDGGQWDYLLRWQQGGSEEDLDLAAADDSEDEERFGPTDGAEEDAQEIPDEEDEPEKGAQSRSKLTPDQVLDIINERIEYYTQSWKPNKGAAKGDEIAYDPEAMWEEAQVAGQRQLVERYEADLAYYSHRLDKLCDEIMNFPGNTADKVRRQCSNLEVTIDSMELAEWLLSIYKLEPVDDSSDDNLDADTEPQRYISAQLEASANFIDLGSPSETSGDDGDGAMGSERATAFARNMEEHQAHSGSQYFTPDSVFADSVEPPMYAHQDPAVLDRPLPLVLHTSYGDEPEHSSIAMVLRWRWDDLIESQDRKRIVSKVVSEMKAEDRELIRTRLKYVGKMNMLKEISTCLGMLSGGQPKMQGVLPRDLPKIITFTRLFLSWWMCDNCFREQPDKRRIEELLNCLKEGLSDPGTFCDYLNTIMTTTFSEEALRHPERPSQAEIIEISDDDEPAPRPIDQRKSNLNATPGEQQGSAIVLD